MLLQFRQRGTVENVHTGIRSIELKSSNFPINGSFEIVHGSACLSVGILSVGIISTLTAVFLVVTDGCYRTINLDGW
jgi:hypothetical protein